MNCEFCGTPIQLPVAKLIVYREGETTHKEHCPECGAQITIHYTLTIAMIEAEKGTTYHKLSPAPELTTIGKVWKWGEKEAPGLKCGKCGSDQRDGLKCRSCGSEALSEAICVTFQDLRKAVEND